MGQAVFVLDHHVCGPKHTAMSHVLESWNIVGIQKKYQPEKSLGRLVLVWLLVKKYVTYILYIVCGDCSQ